jgi:sugar diacid utilization regulator
MHVLRAAERLVVHPNTVHYRLRRVSETTGRDPRRLGDLLELLVATRLSKSPPNS